MPRSWKAGGGGGANDGASYGAIPKNGQKWKDIFATEVRPQISDADWARVHFLGQIPYQHFIPLLQLSTVHVYLSLNRLEQGPIRGRADLRGAADRPVDVLRAEGSGARPGAPGVPSAA